MAAWPRTVLPQRVTDFAVPGPLISRSQSGKYAVRSHAQIGRTWRETYFIDMTDTGDKRLLATIRTWWRNGTEFNIDHRDYLTPNGGGAGSPLVQGASQTGSLLVCDGMTAGSGYLLAGDIFAIAGVDNVFEVATATVSVAGAGTATIAITPPIYSGGSPSNNAALTITGVKLKAMIVEPPDMPETDAANYGLVTVTFGEVV
jgi:hypothetical protein